MATEDVIFVPPPPPINNLTLLDSSNIIDGQVDDRGILPGAMKLAGDGFTTYLFTIPGNEKSSIWLFKSIPVLFDITKLPNLELFEIIGHYCISRNSY